jgi:hypothetical protein
MKKIGTVGDGALVEDGGRRYAHSRWRSSRWLCSFRLSSIVRSLSRGPSRLPSRQGARCGAFHRARAGRKYARSTRRWTSWTSNAPALGERIGALEQAIREAELRDKRAVADWQLAGDKGSRLEATAPAFQAELERVRADIDATAIAEDEILKEKTAFVAKHSKRLAADAGKSRAEAVSRLRQAIASVEGAREEVLEALRAEAWAHHFPGENANADLLGLQLIRGGRTSKTMPELRTQTSAGNVLAYLLDDAAWLDQAVAKTAEDRPLDPHEAAIWEQSEEGREAIALANTRLKSYLQPHSTVQAEWED